ncbi:carbonic anhydrase [uncultured Mycobacterium sp.]|uniref:carbonic anhydrase n=1 Tax=uncultured Mycobacterium sp. TaxID=171292 RepID=UPI0035C98CF1
MSTPLQAWQLLRHGNGRFAAGYRTADGLDQVEDPPAAAMFTCADAGLDTASVFGQAAGALFTVSTWGHVVGAAVVASVEYAVAGLGAPLVVVLGHDGCGAMRAIADDPGAYCLDSPGLQAIWGQILPPVHAASGNGVASPDELETRRVQKAASALLDYSPLLAERVQTGRCAVVCVMVAQDGRARLCRVFGDVGEVALSGEAR